MHLSEFIKSHLSFEPSEEQLKVIEAFTKGNNLQLLANPGSGKSTLCLMLCLVAIGMLKKQSCLILTYSSHLKTELRTRIQALPEPYRSLMASESIHSSGHHYMESCRDDVSLLSIVDDDLPPLKVKSYDVVIFDEMQDCQGTFAVYFKKLLYDFTAGSSAQLVCVGDPRQSIFEFNGSSPLFLLEAPTYFDNGRPWLSLPLEYTYRLPKRICDMVNAHSVDSVPLRPYFPDKPCSLECIWMDLKKDVGRMYEYLHELMTRHNVQHYQDIMILSPCITSGKYSRVFNHLIEHMKIPVYLIDRRTDHRSDDVNRDNKVVISSVHSSKGREAKLVVVFGMDDWYPCVFYRNGKIMTTRMDNTMFVALTRAKECLVVIQDKQRQPLLDLSSFDRILDLSPEEPRRFKALPTSMFNYAVPVTKFCQFFPVVTDYRRVFFKATESTPFEGDVCLHTTWETVYGVYPIKESVSSTLGESMSIFIQLFLEPYKLASLIMRFVKHPLKESLLQKINDIMDGYTKPALSIAFEVAYALETTKELSTWRQKDEIIMTRPFQSVVPDSFLIEKRLRYLLQSFPGIDVEFSIYDKEWNMSGRFDLVHFDKAERLATLIEMKCKERLENSDFLQTMVYYFLACRSYPAYDFTAYLFNVRTNESFCLNKECDFGEIIESIVSTQCSG